MLRKAFLTAAQQYSKPNKTGHKIRLKRQNLSSAELALVERADRRCRKRYYALIATGKNNNVVKTAIARELVGFVWEAMMLLHGGEIIETKKF